MNSVFKEKATALRLALSDWDQRSKNEAEVAAIAGARNRAVAAGDAIERNLSVRSALEARGVVVSGLPAPRRKDAGEGRTALRRVATQLADPDRPVTSLLNGSSVQSALKQAEDLSRVLASAAQAGVEQRRRTLRPDDLDAPVPDLPGQIPVSSKLRLAKARLEEPVVGVAVPDLLDRLQSLEAAADIWRRLRPELDAHVAGLPLAVQRFFQAAATDEGATWSLVTAEVRSWLDEPGRGEQYRVRLG